MSMASVILQAADLRILYPRATLMIHDGYETQQQATPQTFRNWAEFSEKSRNLMYEIFAERSNKKSIAFWKRKCANDTILSAEEAVDLGLADGIYGESP